MVDHLQNLLKPIASQWRWGLRLALLWLLLNQLAPPAHHVFPTEPQQVHTLQPQVCVHTNLIDEVDEWKIQRSFELVREMGADTVVEFFPWAYIEPSEGNYNWYQADRIVRHAEQQGVRIIARMGLVPQWARPDDSTFNRLPEDSEDEFVRFMSAFAARYAGRIDHIIVWNEPNLAFEWGFEPPDPARYVRLLKAAYAPLHAANPQVVVLAGALAPTLEPEGSPHGMADPVFLRRMYEHGAADYFDALAVHTYGFTHEASATAGADQLNFRRAELLRAVMEDFGDGDKAVYVTEAGWNDSPRWNLAVTPSQRIAQTLSAYQHAEANWPWAEKVCLWIFRYPRPQGNYRDHFTLITPEFQVKPLYLELQAYARGLEQNAQLWLPRPGTGTPSEAS